jgi:nucleoside-diphosphate-sugar epimerase
MTYVVTGGCGFIGSHLVESLAADGHAVRIFDNLSSGREQNIAACRSRIELIRGDVRDLPAVRAALRGADYVFHEAALVSVVESVARSGECHEINVTGTRNVLTAAREAGVKRVVLASSAAVYGNDPPLPKREGMQLRPMSPYAVSKAANEECAAAFATQHGLPTVCLRYFNVYGPRQDARSPYAGVISRFAAALLAGRRPTVYGDGRQTRDFVFVRDIVRANILAATRAGVGGGAVFNIATGRPVSLLDILALLRELTGSAAEPEFAEARAADIRHSAADVSAARAALGFEAAVALREGLPELLTSLRSV